MGDSLLDVDADIVCSQYILEWNEEVYFTDCIMPLMYSKLCPLKHLHTRGVLTETIVRFAVMALVKVDT